MNLTIDKLYIYSAAFLAVESSFAYYSFYVFPGVGLLLYAIYLLTFLGFLSKRKLKRSNTKYGISFLLFFLFLYAVSIINGFFPVNVEWLALFYGFSFLCTDEETQCSIYRLFIKFLAFLFCLSLVEFILYNFLGFSYLDVIIPRGYRTYHHLVLNVFEDSITAILPRFQSILDEPGMVGTYSALILCSIWNKKGWYFEKVVFIISGVLSFSLAFFFMMSVVVLFSSGFKLKYLFLASIIIAALYYLLQDYLEALVFSRFYDEDVFARTAYKFDQAFNKAWESGQLWLGKGATSHKLVTDVDDGNAGIKVWIYQYGIIGLILMFTMYTKILVSIFLRFSKVNLACMVYLFIFWLSFYQRSDIEFPYYIVMFFGFPALYRLEIMNNIEKS